MDGDNDVDIAQGAMTSNEEYPWLPGYFYEKAKVLFNDGKGNFTDSGQFLGKGTIQLAAGDIDGDGDKDIVTGSFGGTSMRVYFNDGKGHFTDSQQSLGGYIDFFPRLADFDGDGDLDLYSPTWPSHSPQSHVFLNDGRGFFTEYMESGLNIPGWGIMSAAVFDIDKDNDIDIVEVAWDGITMHTRVLKNNGKAQFTVSQEFNDVGGAVGVADFDNDGDLDFKPESVVKAGNQYILQPVIKVLALSEFKEDLCKSRSVSCDDSNPCTVDSCHAGFCSSQPTQDGTSCGTGFVCKAGQCISETQSSCSNLSFTP